MSATDVSAHGAEDVRWDIEPLVDGEGADGVERHLDRAVALAGEITADAKGRLGEVTSGELAAVMAKMAELHEHLSRAGYYAELRYVTDTADPARGALNQRVSERSAEIAGEIVWFSLEWNQLDDAKVEELLADPALDFCAHHLRSARRYRDHQLSEVEEKLLTETSVTGEQAWNRLNTQLTSALEVDLDGTKVPLDGALARLRSPDREARRAAAEAVTAALQPEVRTLAFIYNTLMADKAADDRRRRYPSWITSRNLANETTDESVQALVDAVVARYDIPQRWYALKAKLLGLDKIADFDRMAPVTSSDETITWDRAKATVLDAYESFSPQLAEVVSQFFDEQWIDAPATANKAGGAFCAYTVPSHHPYVLLNYTAKADDVMTLAHELGHGVHAYLARGQGIFHQTTPLTLAETASVFGETVTFERLLASTDDPDARLDLLVSNVDGNIATIFRQIAMNRFEDAVHTHRRNEGELSVDDFHRHWVETQTAMLGDAVELTEGYHSWWSYIPHFIAVPGYVYAYAYGQLLALSVYARYRDRGAEFVPQYLELLSAGGSMPPEELGRIVDCDITDPEFWDRGLDIVDDALRRTEKAAQEAGRV